MISVITYGRNDNYGFNLYKRTAFGFNCLAEVLTDEDEVLFVDYNTPRHLPTLPEFIWDTLTEKALNLIKVIRIGPETHERIRGNSPLNVLENVSRNAAIVRSDPKNHWMLSTNPDVVLVLASKWSNLAELLQAQPDSFYEMPRFDIPESVWSALPRGEPRQNMTLLRDWLVHHKAAVAETVPDHRFQKVHLFDAPGDFQLAPRDYFFRLRGFDESMNKYLHSDSNLAKRMWLLNGQRTDHLLRHIWVLHQDHYLSGEWATNVGTIVHNDYHEKVLLQAYIEANEENWGLQKEQLPMFSLAAKVGRQRHSFLRSPATVNGNLPLSQELDWRCQPLYRLCHYQPEVLSLYLREVLQVISPSSQLVYVGTNRETLECVRQVWQEIAPLSPRVQDLSELAGADEKARADVLLVDFYYERPKSVERRIELLEKQLQWQLEKRRLRPAEAEEEVMRFADNSDYEQLHNLLLKIWQDLLPHVQTPPGTYVILLGCNTYADFYARFQEAFATNCMGIRLGSSQLQKLHALYQEYKVWIQSRGKQNAVFKLMLGIRLMKRRAFKRAIGHESLMGWIYLHHILSRTRRLIGRLKLRNLYVHHRLVVMQVER